jgi:hypothetical protein
VLYNTYNQCFDPRRCDHVVDVGSFFVAPEMSDFP